MFGLQLRILVLVLAILLLSPAVGTAGWITISNDTKQTVVVQETITIHGQTRRCKPIKLAPGEVLREFQPSGGSKKLTVYDNGLLARQLYSGTVTWKDDTSYTIHKDADKYLLSDTAKLTAKGKENSPPKDPRK